MDHEMDSAVKRQKSRVDVLDFDGLGQRTRTRPSGRKLLARKGVAQDMLIRAATHAAASELTVHDDRGIAAPP